jgi:hypothetical protein
MITAAATNKKDAKPIIMLRKPKDGVEQKLLDLLWKGHFLLLLLLLKPSIVFEWENFLRYR